jgi:hypothetical protein
VIWLNTLAQVTCAGVNADGRAHGEHEEMAAKTCRFARDVSKESSLV